MTKDFRGPLFLSSIAMLLVIGVISALFLRAEVAATVERRLQDELVHHARGARIGVEALPGIAGPAGSAMAARFAEATRTRLEVISTDGVMLASSATGEIAGDVRTQPEVAAALDDRLGAAQRGGRILVAVPFHRPDGVDGVIRVSAPLEDLDRALDRLYFLLGIAVAIGIGVAIVMTAIASSIMARSVRELEATARNTDQLTGDLVRTDSALERQRILLRSVVDGISVGVVVLDAHNRITLINRAAAEILDIDDQAVGQALIDLVRIPALVGLLEPAMARNAELLTPRGTRVIARIERLDPVAGSLVMLEDVTAVRRLETIRRDFVANVSHELRTPVSIIRANAETLIGGAKDDPVFGAKLIDGLHRNAERLARILADLLDLSRLEAGQFRIETAPVAVRNAVDQAVAALDHAISDKKAELVISVPDDLEIRGDAKALDQVLVNLVDNAVKYTQPGGHVWVESEERDAVVRINVKDDGPGIALHHRERIFERFYRVDAGRSRDIGGTGLGLSIVKHLIESMGGQIGVSANAPTGTVFWVELPRA